MDDNARIIVRKGNDWVPVPVLSSPDGDTNTTDAIVELGTHTIRMVIIIMHDNNVTIDGTDEARVRHDDERVIDGRAADFFNARLVQ